MSAAYDLLTIYVQSNAININLKCEVVHCVIGEVGHFGAGQLCSLS